MVQKWQPEITSLLSENFCLIQDGSGLHLPDTYYSMGFPPEFVDKFVVDYDTTFGPGSLQCGTTQLKKK